MNVYRPVYHNRPANTGYLTFPCGIPRGINSVEGWRRFNRRVSYCDIFPGWRTVQKRTKPSSNGALWTWKMKERCATIHHPRVQLAALVKVIHASCQRRYAELHLFPGSNIHPISIRLPIVRFHDLRNPRLRLGGPFRNLFLWRISDGYIPGIFRDV